MYTGRKFTAWLIGTVLSFVALAFHLITADIWRDVFLGITTVFTIGNVASKFTTTNTPTNGQGE